MKRAFSLAVAVLFLTACGSGGEGNSESESPTPSVSVGTADLNGTGGTETESGVAEKSEAEDGAEVGSEPVVEETTFPDIRTLTPNLDNFGTFGVKSDMDKAITKVSTQAVALLKHQTKGGAELNVPGVEGVKEATQANIDAVDFQTCSFTEEEAKGLGNKPYEQILFEVRSPNTQAQGTAEERVGYAEQYLKSIGVRNVEMWVTEQEGYIYGVVLNGVGVHNVTVSYLVTADGFDVVRVASACYPAS